MEVDFSSIGKFFNKVWRFASRDADGSRMAVWSGTFLFLLLLLPLAALINGYFGIGMIVVSLFGMFIYSMETAMDGEILDWQIKMINSWKRFE